MAELNVEQAQKLARDFLTGRGGPAISEDARRAMQGDEQLALELLQQMQTALDEIAPAPFTPDQWREVDARVRSLIAPLAKSRFGFIGRFFSKLFSRKPKEKVEESSSRVKRRGGVAPVVAPEPTGLVAANVDGMEEMAPIAAPAALPEVPSGAAAAVVVAEPPPVKAKRVLPVKKIALTLGAFLVLGGLGYGVMLLHPMDRWRAWRASKVVVPLPSPVPTLAPQPTLPPTPQPSPTPKGPPARGFDKPAYDALPAELPPQTPQPAGVALHLKGLEAQDSTGQNRLPLPAPQ